MPHLNPFAISALLTAITCFLLSILTFICRKTKLHKIWILFNLSIAGWALCIFLASISSNPTKAYNLWRVSHIIGIYVSIFLFHAICIFCNLHHSKLIKLSYLYGLLHNAANLINKGSLLYEYNSTKHLFNSIHYIQAKNLNFTLGLFPWIFLAVYGVCLLLKYYKNDPSQTGYSTRLWAFTIILGYLGGLSPFLPMLGINIYPFALFLLPIYALITTYSIFRFQFLSLNFIIEEGIVYSLLIASISILYLAIVVSFEKLLQFSFGYQTTSLSLLSIFIIGIMVIPIRNKIQFMLDRSLFTGTHPEIAKQNKLLRQEVAQAEKHKAVATLASGIAHEVRNPLTALKTFHEHFPDKKDDPEFIEKFNRIAGKEIGRIENLIQQLLDFAKPSPATFQEADIHQLIEDTLQLTSNKISKNNIRLVKTLTPAPCSLSIDSNKIKQALLNIILNAIDAMPEGGRLTVSSSVYRISDIEKLEIRIQDTGDGIQKKDLKHIFEPFYSKKKSGTGLGLAITRGIIEEHRGKIKVNSIIDKGTEFIIELPL